MRVRASWWMSGIMVSCFAAQGTRAQESLSFPPANVELSIDGVLKSPTEPIFINRRMCDASKDGGAGASIKIVLTNLGATPARDARVLEFWLGEVFEDCAAPAARMRSEAGTSCDYIPPTQRGFSEDREVITLKAHDIFTSDPLNPRCDRAGVRVLHIVPTVNPAPTAQDRVPDEALGAPMFVRFEADFEAPAPVQGLADARGESLAELQWLPSSLDPTGTFEVYVDTSAVKLANPGPCSSSVLQQGVALPEGDDRVLLVHKTALHVGPVDVTVLGLLPGEKLPAAVVVRDAAGNPSVVSEVVCLERAFVEPQGPRWAEGRDSCFDECSLRAGGSDQSARGWWWSALPALLCARRTQRSFGRLRLRFLRVRKSS